MKIMIQLFFSTHSMVVKGMQQQPTPWKLAGQYNNCMTKHKHKTVEKQIEQGTKIATKL